MPLNSAEDMILERSRKNPASRSARALASALRISTAEINRKTPSESVGPDSLIIRFGEKLDLEILNDYKVILSKKDGCILLRTLGVQGLSDKNDYLNRHIDNTKYYKIFNRSVSKCNGKGNARLVLTYGEILHFYTSCLGKRIPESLVFPESLIDLADEGDVLFP